jgi:hypothetical protein
MYTIQSGNIVSVSDRVEMFVVSSSDMRQCYVRAPYLFNARPVVMLTMTTELGTKLGSQQVLIPYAVEPTPATGETVFKVTARFELGKGDNTVCYWCDFTITGELAS